MDISSIYHVPCLFEGVSGRSDMNFRSRVFDCAKFKLCSNV